MPVTTTKRTIIRNNKQPRTRINGFITSPELRIIDDEGAQLGIMTRSEALKAAREADLDLVEVSPTANPPVAKITDWGKYQYQKAKQLKTQRKAQKSSEIKQIRLGLKIGDHDLDTKLNRCKNFLEAGHKVKFSLLYRGRENIHRDLGFELLDKIITKLQDVAVVDQSAQLAGRNLTLVVRRNQNAKN